MLTLSYLLFSLQYFITLHLLWLLRCTLLQATSVYRNANHSTAWREKPVTLESPSSVQGQGLMPAGDSSGRRVSTPLLKTLVHWPWCVGNNVCSTAVPDVSWEESQQAVCLICVLIAVLCLYFCPSRHPAFGNLAELVLENTLQNILIEASHGEVVLTARPRVIALPPSPSQR